MAARRKTTVEYEPRHAARGVANTDPHYQAQHRAQDDTQQPAGGSA